jgi:hypothetical protein
MRFLAMLTASALAVFVSPETALAQAMWWQAHSSSDEARARSLSAEELVRDLRSDNIYGNADAALGELHWHRDLPEIQEPLERALRSRDAQQRRLAAYVLGSKPGYTHPSRQFALVLVENSRDDDVGWNAINTARIVYRWSGQHGGGRLPQVIVDAFEQALDSEDHQQRQFAALVLADVSERGWYDPPPRFYEVALEGLRDDEFPWGFIVDSTFANASAFTSYLVHHPAEGTRSLRRALHSSDPQQRGLAAYILKRTGRWRLGDPPPIDAEALFRENSL